MMDILNPQYAISGNHHRPVTSDDLPAILSVAKKQLAKERERLARYQTALRLANVELAQRNRNILDLSTFTYQASRAGDVPSLVELVLKQALATTVADMGAVVLIEQPSKALTLGHHQGLTLPLSKILTGENYGDGATALMPHLVAGTGALLESTTDDETECQLLEASQVHSLVSMPLRVGKKLWGALIVGVRERHAFRSADLTFLVALVQEAAIALDGLRLRERIWRIAENFLSQEEVKALALTETTEIELDLDIIAPVRLNEITKARPETNNKQDVEQLLSAMAEAESEIQQQYADLQILSSLTEMINSSLNLSEVLQCAVDQSQEILATDAAWLYLVEEEQLRMYAHRGLSKDYVHGMRRMRLTDGVEGDVVMTNKPLFIPSILKRPHKIWVDKEGLRAMAVVPITRPHAITPNGQQPKWQVMGVLATGIRTTQDRDWSPREMRLLISIANQVALAVDNAQLYAQVQQNEVSLRGSNEILREINDMLIQKNASFERFIHQDLKPSLTEVQQSVQQIFKEGSHRLTTTQRQHLTILQQIIDDLKGSTHDVLKS